MKFIRLLKIFYPSNFKKVVSKLYYIAESENGRTMELTELIKSKQVQSFVEIGVYDGDNLLKLAKRFPNVSFIGVDPY